MPLNKSEDDILAELDRHFTTALDHPTWVQWRKDAQFCFAYKEGDQWTSAEKAELKKRGQPQTVNNQISVTVNRMVGQFVKQKTRIGYRGRNSPVDDPVAQTLTDLFLFIRQNNALEFEEREMAEDGFTGGFGVLDVYLNFNDLLEPEIKIRAEDPFNIFPDPFSRRYDWNEDASYILRAKWVDVDEAKALWPEKAKELEHIFTPVDNVKFDSASSFRRENYVDSSRRRIRVIEDYYKHRERQSIILYNDGQPKSIDATELSKKDLGQLKKQFPDHKQIDRARDVMYSATFTQGVLFEHKKREEKYFPFIPYFVTRKKDGEPYSLVLIGLSMQDAINKRESKAIHLLSNNRSFYEQGAITDKSELATELARPDGQVETNRGFFEKFRVDEHTDVGPIHFQMHNQAKDDFRRIVGINPDAFGERSEVRSGVGIARKQAMTDIIVAPVFDNLRRTRQLLAKVVLELIQNYYSEPKIYSITDDLNKVRSVNFDASTIESIKQSIYDVVVEDLPDVTTIQEEQMQILATTLPQILPFGPFWVTVLLQMSEVRNKEELIKQIQQMSGPPPADPKISVALQWAELMPPEKAAFAAKMGMEELAQIEMQAQTPPAHIVKAQTDLQKEQIKGQGGQEKLAQEQFKAKADMAKTQMDMAATQQKHKLDITKAQMDMRNAQQKHQMDMQKEALGMMRDQVKAQNDGNERNSGSV